MIIELVCVIRRCLQPVFCIRFAQAFQGRSALYLPSIYRVLKRQPQDRLIQIAVLIFPDAPKQFFDLRVIVMFSYCADDTVEIQFRFPVLIVSLEIRYKTVISRRIPDYVNCPFLLEVRDLFEIHVFSVKMQGWFLSFFHYTLLPSPLQSQ